MATFGFLEKQLARAIFKLTGTVPAPRGEARIKRTLEKWHKMLEGALSGTLVHLIDKFGSAVRKNPRCRPAYLPHLAKLTKSLRKAAEIRNMLCHASWEQLQASGGTVPLYVNKKLAKFESKVDAAWLDHLQRGTAELVCDVYDAVTHMGYQFPGSTGPGD